MAAKILWIATDRMRLWRRQELTGEAEKTLAKLPRKTKDEDRDTVWLARIDTSDTDREQPQAGDYIERIGKDGVKKYWIILTVGKVVAGGDPSVYVKRSTYVRVERCESSNDAALANLIAAKEAKYGRAIDAGMNS